MTPLSVQGAPCTGKIPSPSGARDLDTRGVKIFRLGQMGDSLYYFQDRPDRWGVSPTLQLYFACILPQHSQTPRTINQILTQCLSSMRP